MGLTAAISAIAGTAYSVYSGERAADAQKKAQEEAKQNALKQEKAADEAFNAANRKKPDTMALLASQQAGKTGVSSTLLTGPGGVNSSALTLGKSTLLGQ